MKDRIRFWRIPAGLLCAAALYAQPAQVQPAPGTPQPAAPVQTAPRPAQAVGQGGSYVLGPLDQVTLASLEAEEVNGKTYQIDSRGYATLPLVGRIHAAGLTTRDLEDQLAEQFGRYVKGPRISVTISEYRSQPISVLGAVNTPGVHYLRGNLTVIEALSAAGGLRNDAGNRVMVTRRVEEGRLPLEDARQEGGFSVAELELNSILQASRPQDNILIKSNDVITVPRADLVYVIGDVVKPGGYVLTEKRDMTVLEALALAGGTLGTAAKGNTRILRSVHGSSNRTEEQIHLGQILAGKSPDVRLGPDDMLFIPGSASKKTVLRIAEAAIQTVSGVAIFRSGR